MGLSTLNPAKYGKLCADVIPKLIESDEEFDRLVAKMGHFGQYRSSGR